MVFLQRIGMLQKLLMYIQDSQKDGGAPMSAIYQLLQQSFPHLPKTEVLDAEGASKRYASNTLGDEFRLACAISLTEPNDIKALVLLAIEHDFIIQPVSSGKNWGYGSVSFNGEREVVLLDLGKMNKIRVIDKMLGLINVQPGVTQQQLHDFLSDNHWDFMTPVTGAGPTCSILSNALERGYGITPHTDHFAAVNKVSAIIPNPALWNRDNTAYVYESAVADLDLSPEQMIDHTYKWGLGSYLEGIFTQSAMGIVTDITLRLAPKPEGFSSFYIKINDANKLSQAVDFVRDTLRSFEGIVGSINLMDRRRLLSMVTDNPNGRGNHTVMTNEQITTLSKQNDVPEWMIAGSIYGKPQVVKAVKRLIKQQSQFADQVLFSDGPLIKFGRWLSNSFPYGFLKAAKHQLEALDEGIDIMLGKPRQVALPLAYWRNPRITADKNRLLNPDQDECGLLWYAPLIPMDNQKIAEFVALIRRTTPKYKIEPLITFTNLKHDCIDSTIPIIYDVQNPEAKQNAYDCLDELYEEGRKLGYVPYRMNVDQQRSKLSSDAIHWKLVKQIKAVLDPHSILSPGRYNP